MKKLLVLFFLVHPFISFGQLLSSQSNPVYINIHQENKSNDISVSNLVQMKIRYESFSNQSPAINFTSGESRNTTPSAVQTVPSTEKQTISVKKTIEDIKSDTPNYYSLIIGINDYQNNDHKLQDLNYAVRDATQLQKVLTKEFTFQTDNSFLLENPTRQEIIQALEKLALIMTSKDNLLIFYAGHGVWDERIKVGYWLPADSKLNEKSNWISNSTVRDYIAGINSKHTLLVTDACFSGSIFKTREVNLTALGMSSLYQLPSRKAMTSGTLTSVPDESKFMHYFLKRLKDTEDTYISSRQLFYSIETAVLNNTRTVPQFGVIQDTGDEGGDFIFIKR